MYYHMGRDDKSVLGNAHYETNYSSPVQQQTVTPCHFFCSRKAGNYQRHFFSPNYV